MTEAYSTAENVGRWYGTAERPGSHVPFNFAFIADITRESNATEFKKAVDDFMLHMPSHAQGQVRQSGIY